MSKIDSIDSELFGIYNYLGEMVDNFDIYFWWNPDNWNISETDKPAFNEYMSNAPKGWINFWNTFNNKSLKDVLVEVSDEIENKANPLSEENEASFNEVMTAFNSDTVFGSLNEVKDNFLPKLLDSLTGQKSSFTFTIGSAKNSFISLPESTFTLDLSFYLKYKEYGDMLIGGFMWLSYIWLLIKRGPSIIHGESLAVEGVLEIPDLIEAQDNTERTIMSEQTTYSPMGDVVSHSTTTTTIDGDGNRSTVTQLHKKGRN